MGRAWMLGAGCLETPGIYNRLYKRSAPRARGLWFITVIHITEEGLGFVSFGSSFIADVRSYE